MEKTGFLIDSAGIPYFSAPRIREAGRAAGSVPEWLSLLYICAQRQPDAVEYLGIYGMKRISGSSGMIPVSAEGMADRLFSRKIRKG